MLSVSIIIPTRNEEENIVELLMQAKCFGEVIVVDDSDDETPILAQHMGAKVLKGQRKGLGQAIIDGIDYSKCDVVLVMDADLSHNPQDIPRLLKPILDWGYDMTIGSRYVNGGSTVGWTAKRTLISKIASLMAYPITWIRDNTSGFFAIRREALKGIKLRADSWKIMLEALVRANPTAVMEVPICFKDRTQGKSKFTFKEVRHYIVHLIKLALHKYKAVIKFGVIGVSGALLHFSVLYALTDVFHLWYLLSAALSIVVASTSNYILNHKWTFTDRQISNHLIGWLKYQVMSAITDFMYLGMLALFVEVFGFWYMAGAFVSALIIFPVKFVVASSLIWSKKLDTKQADYEWVAFFNGSLVQKWWKRKIANIVWDWIPDTKSLLDYGCGSSPICTRYDKVVGYDTNDAKLQYMKLKCPKATFANGTLNKMAKFDDIMCIETIEHIEDPEGLLSRFSSMMDTNGRLVIATPDYSKVLWHLAEKFTPYKEEHITKYNRQSLEALCRRHGFVPVKHKYVAWCDLCEMFVKG